MRAVRKPGPAKSSMACARGSSADRRGTRHGSGPAAPGAAPAPSRSGTAWRAARRQSARAAYRRWCCRPADWERPARSAFAAESPVRIGRHPRVDLRRVQRNRLFTGLDHLGAHHLETVVFRVAAIHAKSGRARTASGWCSGKCSGIRCCCLVEAALEFNISGQGRFGYGLQRGGGGRLVAARRRPGSGCGETGHQTASHQK